MQLDNLISSLKTQQLPYKKLSAGDYIYDLAPKKIAVNFKIAPPDSLKDILGDNININIFSISSEDSFWHSLIYALLPDRYNKLNWHYRKLLVERFITALDMRCSTTIANSTLLKNTNLKSDDISVKEINCQLIFYICLILNINIIVYTCGIVHKTDYHYPTAKYDSELPTILFYCNEVPHYSLITINDDFIFSYDSFVSQQISKKAPLSNTFLKNYISKKCSAELYADVYNIDLEKSKEIIKKSQLSKFKLSELKSLYLKLNADVPESETKGRLTKQILIDKILNL